MANEEQIRQRAYEIWVNEGRVEGRETQHWRQAEQELAGGGEDVVASFEPGSITPVGAPAEPAASGVVSDVVIESEPSKGEEKAKAPRRRRATR
ncbi:DUF2934 domain-containing protein [Aurantimonas sp. MSK8Z-1]|uniref:DUF2934 domain-containing protein n=1 Tax=Mangrovibrevibacter kandeliae TaxID=2968473 RepID=UPI002117E99C|nr:DUF2934 domain-containing protein [Aurantimonas sp. MSK8Z-1]MCW4116077.1 DUF2934 domain-containing protein [Aurantimonas sp. MSK8Z-1]